MGDILFPFEQQGCASPTLKGSICICSYDETCGGRVSEGKQLVETQKLGC